MSAEFLWTMPVRGDGRRARRDEWNRGGWHRGIPTSPSFVTDDRRTNDDPFEHLEAVAVAAEHAGFDGIVVPYDIAGEESWIVSAVAARSTRWLRVTVEFSPSITTPVYAAKLSTTLQRVAHGRLDWRLALDLDDSTSAAEGDRLEGSERYRRADEFLTIAQAVWREKGFDFEGRYYAVDSGGFGEPLNVHEFPRVHLAGSTPEALAFGAKHADVHYLDASGDLEADIAELHRLSSEIDRSPKVAISLPIIAREDRSEAVARARRLLEERGEASASDLEELSLGEGRWGGFDRVGFGQSVGLFGSYEDVAAGLRHYRSLGVEVFLLDGYPHTEEAYRVGQYVARPFTESEPVHSARSGLNEGEPS